MWGVDNELRQAQIKHDTNPKYNLTHTMKSNENNGANANVTTKLPSYRQADAATGFDVGTSPEMMQKRAAKIGITVAELQTSYLGRESSALLVKLTGDGKTPEEAIAAIRNEFKCKLTTPIHPKVIAHALAARVSTAANKKETREELRKKALAALGASSMIKTTTPAGGAAGDTNAVAGDGQVAGDAPADSNDGGNVDASSGDAPNAEAPASNEKNRSNKRGK